MSNTLFAVKNVLHYRLRHGADELTTSLVERVEDTINEFGINAHRRDFEDALYLVEDLAVVWGGVMRMAYDVPNHGRLTESNPEAAPILYHFPYSLATEAGFIEVAHYGMADIPRLDDPRSYGEGASRLQQLIDETYPNEWV